MFREKPALDRITDAISDIGERIVDLEERVVERLHPTPSTPERLRRAVARHLPGHTTGVSRYIPDFLSGWSLPTAEDARSGYRSVRDQVASLGSSIYGLRDQLPDVQDVRDRLPDTRALTSRLPSWRKVQRSVVPSSRLDYFRDRPALTALLVVGGTVAVAGAAWFVTRKVSEHTEEPDYDVVRKDGDIEIRDYDAMVVAETVKSGYHEKARRLGFDTLADYIFANNRSGKKIPMTAPVLQQLSENEGQTRGWAIRFVMPKRFTKGALPAPASNDVALKDVPAKRVVAIRFSGNFTASLASKKLMLLYNYLSDENLKQKGDPEYAFYNPPWTPGVFKRNEILIEIER